MTRKYKITTTKVSSTSGTTPATSLLYGKDLSEYDNMDVDELLTQLSAEELEQLSNEVDPDDSLLPADQRCKDQTRKLPTGPLNRKKLLDYLTKVACEDEDWPEIQPFKIGHKRGKIYTPKIVNKTKLDEDFEVELDLEEDYEGALTRASEAELVDLAAILGLHSMLNQDQYHASILNKGQQLGDKFESIVRATQPKALPLEPDNPTDVDKTLKQVEGNDKALNELNWNNIKSISKERMKRLFEGLKKNSSLKSLHLANTTLTDSAAETLIEAIKENKTLTTLNVESNYLSGPTIRDMIDAILNNQAIVEFRASNQKPQILGNKIEMDIAKAVEKNPTMLRLGLSFDVPDARVRVTHHLQKNYDNVRLKRIGSDS